MNWSLSFSGYTLCLSLTGTVVLVWSEKFSSMLSEILERDWFVSTAISNGLLPEEPGSAMI